MSSQDDLGRVDGYIEGIQGGLEEDRSQGEDATSMATKMKEISKACPLYAVSAHEKRAGRGPQ